MKYFQAGYVIICGQHLSSRKQFPMLKRFSLAISALFLLALATSAQTKTLAATPVKTSDNSPASAVGVKIIKVDIMVDTSIRVKPTNAYMSMEFSTVTGTTMTEVLSGNNLF